MSYRLQQPKPPKMHRDVQEVTTPNKFIVNNGSTAEFAFPCWYYEIRPHTRAVPYDRQWHDYLGWPTDISQEADLARHPEHMHWLHGRPDIAGPMALELDMTRLVPIHLRAEGYNTVKFNLYNPPAGLTVTCWVDGDPTPVPKYPSLTREDWIIRALVAAQCPSAQTTPVPPVPFSVTISDGTRTDVAARGHIVIVPTIIGA